MHNPKSQFDLLKTQEVNLASKSLRITQEMSAITHTQPSQKIAGVGSIKKGSQCMCGGGSIWNASMAVGSPGQIKKLNYEKMARFTTGL